VHEGLRSSHMAEVPSRELRNNTAAVLRRVQEGEEITITVRGKPVAEVVPIGSRRKKGLTFAELFDRLENLPGEHDPTFARDMERIKGEYSDEVPLHPWEDET
jgi:prevent-host-death family protein